MAIYQFNIVLIPRQSIVDKYGEIPTKLFIDHQAWERYWKKEGINNYDFEDSLTIAWWKKRNILFTNREPFINNFTKQVEWTRDSTDSKTYGDSETNDFNIGLTTEGFIEDFSCRIDLRKLDTNFIGNIFILSQHLECLLLDKKGNLFEPTFDKLIENFKQSNSFNFVANPSDFFDKLSIGQIKQE